MLTDTLVSYRPAPGFAYILELWAGEAYATEGPGFGIGAPRAAAPQPARDATLR